MYDLNIPGNKILKCFICNLSGDAFFLSGIIKKVAQKVVGVIKTIKHALGGNKPMKYEHMTPRMNKDFMFGTDTSWYQKISSSKYQGFHYWESRCRGKFHLSR